MHKIIRYAVIKKHSVITDKICLEGNKASGVNSHPSVLSWWWVKWQFGNLTSLPRTQSFIPPCSLSCLFKKQSWRKQPREHRICGLSTLIDPARRCSGRKVHAWRLAWVDPKTWCQWVGKSTSLLVYAFFDWLFDISMDNIKRFTRMGIILTITEKLSVHI